MPTQQKTSETLERVNRLLHQSPACTEAANLVSEAGFAIGLPLCAIIDDVSGNSPTMDTTGRRLVDYFGWPEWMIDKWYSRAYIRQHPVYLRCRFEKSVFWVQTEKMWSSLGPLTPAQEQMKSDMKKQGSYGTVVVPVHLSLGRTAAVVWSAQKEIDLDRVVRLYTRQLRSIAYGFLDILLADEPSYDELRELAYLTERQINCLSWLAQGKTIAETATILDISVHTIREHLRETMKRLNAVNTTHAVAIACELGIVKPLLDRQDAVG